MIRDVILRAVLITAKTMSAMHPTLNGFPLDSDGSIFNQKIAGRKKQMTGAAVDPIRPKTKSRGGFTHAISQVKIRMDVIVI